MLRPEMNLPERSEFSSQALLLIRFQILYFSQIPEWNKNPTTRISVPFYPGNSEYFPAFLNSSSLRQIQIFKGLRKCIIDWLFCFFGLFSHICGHIPFISPFSFLLFPLLEGGELFFMSAGTYETLGIAFSYKLHFLMAYRAAGVGAAGEGFPIAAFRS